MKPSPDEIGRVFHLLVEALYVSANFSDVEDTDDVRAAFIRLRDELNASDLEDEAPPTLNDYLSRNGKSR